MPMIHRVLRRELGGLPRLVETSSTDTQRRALVANHAAETLHFLHVHHEGEDELLWPVLRPRVPESAELIDRLEDAHHKVSGALSEIDPGLQAWSLSGDPAAGEVLAEQLRSLNSVLFAHLDEEESQLLPIAGANVTPEEWAKLGEHGFAAVPPKRRLAVLGAILAEASPEERQKFLTHVPAPARVMYKLFGEKQYKKEVAKLA
jgi:hypothetical protein